MDNKYLKYILYIFLAILALNILTGIMGITISILKFLMKVFLVLVVIGYVAKFFKMQIKICRNNTEQILWEIVLGVFCLRKNWSYCCQVLIKLTNQISILHEHLTTKTKKFIACEPKISSASFALARVRFFDGSLRWNFWLFFPYDVLNKNANLIMNLWTYF